MQNNFNVIRLKNRPRTHLTFSRTYLFCYLSNQRIRWWVWSARLSSWWMQGECSDESLCVCWMCSPFNRKTQWSNSWPLLVESVDVAEPGFLQPDKYNPSWIACSLTRVYLCFLRKFMTDMFRTYITSWPLQTKWEECSRRWLCMRHVRRNVEVPLVEVDVEQNEFNS